MSLKPRSVNQYRVFLASPGDVAAERQYVRTFFDEYNRHTAHIWNVEFKVVDWENYATIGVGRPQELITRQTLEQWQKVLAYRQRMQDLKNPVFYTEYPGPAGFGEVFERDLNRWLADEARPWATERAAQLAAGGATAPVRLPAEFEAERYRAAVRNRRDRPRNANANVAAVDSSPIARRK